MVEVHVYQVGRLGGRSLCKKALLFLRILAMSSTRDFATRFFAARPFCKRR
jgi:hypothetical protein